jgi:hypothetical protein
MVEDPVGNIAWRTQPQDMVILGRRDYCRVLYLEYESLEFQHSLIFLRQRKRPHSWDHEP